MRLSRFFVNGSLQLGESDLPVHLAHYMGTVLRLSEGSTVQLFDGSGSEYLGEVISVSRKKVRVNLTKQLSGLGESPLYTHLGQALAKGERMDFVVQKATELGVNEITPLFTERCEVRLTDERMEKRLNHWQQIAISACEQCGRSKLPMINQPLPINQWLAQVQADLKLVLHPVANPLDNYPKPDSLALLIGPEGGFSDDEIQTSKVHDFQHMRLGGRVLRTETAPIVALSIAQQLWGDF